MNERIKQLAEQAFFDEATSRPSDKMYTFSDHKMAKFAELIVKECIETLRLVPYNSDREFGDEAIYQEAIVKHFGVEEQQKVSPKHKCSVCGTTENVKYMGGYQPYLCDSVDCIPF